MNISIIGPAYPFRGGIASYNERLAQEFQSLGHEVSIETFTTQYPNFLFPGKTQFSESPAPSNLKIRRSFSSVNPFSWLKLGWRLKKNAPDLVILRYWLPFMGPSLGTIARIAKSNRKTKIYTIVDNIIPHEKRIGDKALSRYFVGCNDGFIAMSKSVLNELESFDASLPRILQPHPLFDNFGRPVTKEEACKVLNIDKECNYLLFFGFVRKYKGLDILLNAMDTDWLEEFNIKLIVAGEYYDNSETYDAIIQEKNLQSYIIPANNFIRDDEVKYYFSASDLVVQPYRTATQSGVTQIAYQFGKPMIVTKVGGLPELVKDGKAGVLTEVDANSVKEAIVSIYSEKGKLKEMETFVEKEKLRFSWSTMCNRILNLTKEA